MVLQDLEVPVKDLDLADILPVSKNYPSNFAQGRVKTRLKFLMINDIENL